MKVGLITSVPLNPPWDQGDKNLAYTLTKYLPDINFSVLTARSMPEPVGSNLLKLPLFRNRVPNTIEKARIYGWYLRKSLLGLREYEVDLYHLSYQPFGFSSWMLRWLPEFHRVPSIHTVPATATSHSLSNSYFFADRVVALSEYGRQKLVGMGLSNVRHIPIGIDLQEWSLSPDQVLQSKIKLGVEGRKVLLFPGHYSEAYGIDVLLAAMPAISSIHPDAVYILACRMRSKKEWVKELQVKQEVENMGLTHAVKHMHSIDDMNTVIGASDLVIMPFMTMRDKIDIPTTLLEAMAAGKPFVISDTPPMNELVQREGSQIGAENVGYLHKPGDAEDLTNSTLKILGQDSLRLAMGDNGRMLVRKRFDILKVAAEYREQYLELVS